uniref:Orc1-like AAA ATPase domain-containing protein n=1 Tax=Entomoneis paludosa TaxID=265537 RepID=A0A7S2Y9V2_9STRA|mmetsp:Transcript_24116/g.50136  ORF Transcript_24116/g.50136 Transcript_24116/m.50136 type:complete len:1149 (+) Transcript_24116:82-3528(+)|eukprot:CAMPEP_0172446460 /NCGR_PEP_ID=MMETSP1065-20121228/6054_1 /TAXON_ID=265537 /ORGANISM="Amphiprora paludosa, Strain CCMP125" /LENGTH=1148 /DNA_ID=CAMNT_0013197587 /DNA_START=77 /DNA_END=3523 /DNA_ORIENTATION=-
MSGPKPEDDSTSMTGGDGTQGSVSRRSRLIDSNTQDFSKNRLQFHKMDLVGREEEVKTLQGCLQHHVKNKKSHVVMIRGESGTGKTRLAESIADTLASPPFGGDKTLMVRGKFDLLLQDEPYIGVISAMEDLLDRVSQLQTSNPDKYNTIVRNLTKKLDTAELKLLVHMVPFFNVIVGNHLKKLKKEEMKRRNSLGSNDSVGSRDSGDKNSSDAIDNAKSQFQETFKRFIRVITKSYAPLVILLDDLQWADNASLDLMEHILLGQEEDHYSLFVIGLYRSNEVDETHILNKHISHLRDRHSNNKIVLTQVTVGNLSEGVVRTYAKALLSMQNAEGDEKTRIESLARVLFQKTQGNIFSLISFLNMLNEKKYVVYQLNSEKWSWNMKDIEMKTQSTENVVSLLLDRMQALENNSSRDLLRLMACLGSTCQESVLVTLWSQMQMLLYPTESPEEFKEDLKKSLTDLVQTQGFVLEVGGSDNTKRKYKWIHDTIQEAALMLTPLAERNSYQRQVGEILAQFLKPKELESVIFVVAQLVSHAPDEVKDPKKRLWFANFNLRASQRAAKVAAFANAKRFAFKGIAFLPKDKWQSCTSLTRNLYMNLIQSLRICGEIPEMEKYCSVFLSAQKDEPIEVRLGAYQNLLTGIFYADPKGRGSEAIEIGFKALKELGCKFPKGGMGIVFNTLKGVGFLKKVKKKIMAAASDSKSLNLTMMKTPKDKLESTKLMYALMDILYLTKDSRFPLVIIKYIEYTVEYGIAPHAPSVFGLACALMTGVLNDLEGGAVYAKFALQIMDQVKYRPINTGTMMMSYSLGLAWTTPVSDVAKQMVLSYDMGLRTGEREYTAIAAFQYINFSLQTGKHLDDLETDCRFYLGRLRREEIHLTGDYVEFALFVVMTLKGGDTSKVMANIKRGVTGRPNSRSPASEKDHFYVYWTKKLLAAHMGDFETCAKSSIAHGDIIKQAFPGSPGSMVDPLVRGLSCMVVARRTGSKNMLKEGKRLWAIIKDWIKQGNPNVIHYDAILDAEHDAISQKDAAKVMKKYERAVSLAAAGGFPHDAALFYECWGLYALENLGDKEEAEHRLKQSFYLYKEWGAYGRLESMKTKYSKQLEGVAAAVAKDSDTILYSQPSISVKRATDDRSVSTNQDFSGPL